MPGESGQTDERLRVSSALRSDRCWPEGVARHEAFYSDPVEWAAANGITTGKTPTMFDPLTGVTRGESVTFDYRYDQNIMQPALAAIEADIAALQAVQPFATGTFVDSDYQQLWESPGAAGGAAQLAGTRVFDIAAGATVTYGLVCARSGVSSHASVFDSVLSAIFTAAP